MTKQQPQYPRMWFFHIFMFFLTMAILAATIWMAEQSQWMHPMEEWAMGMAEFIFGAVLAGISFASGIFPMYIFGLAGIALVLMGITTLTLAPIGWLLMLVWFVIWVTMAVIIYRLRMAVLKKRNSAIILE